MKIDWKKEIKLPRPSLSVKRPSVKKPSLKRPKALSAGPSIKLPRGVTDLYGDLRDRHLLPLVALLIVAIIAAPILLNKSSDSKAEAPAAVAPSTGNEAPASSFSVVPAARRLRSPAKRLAHRQPLDPFRIEKKKQKQGGSKSGEGTSGGATTSSTTLGGPTAGAEPTAPRSAEIKVTETPAGDKGLTIKESTSSTGTTSTPSNESSGSEASPTPVRPGTTSKGTSTPTEGSGGQTEVVGYTVDLKAGDPTGELVEENEVAPMTKLPTAKNPLIVFVGLSQDNKRALFLMTSKVTAYYGDVHCAVDKQACQLVELKPGKAALFEYASGEAEGRYKVVLEKIEPVFKAQAGVERGVETTVRETTTEHPAEAKGESPKPRAYALSAARRFSK
jgi:hypothetical protein